MSQKPCKGRGVCAVCWLSFKTRASDGAIHRHGHRSDPCLGSKQPPAPLPTSIPSPSIADTFCSFFSDKISSLRVTLQSLLASQSSTADPPPTPIPPPP